MYLIEVNIGPSLSRPEKETLKHFCHVTTQAQHLSFALPGHRFQMEGENFIFS